MVAGVVRSAVVVGLVMTVVAVTGCGAGGGLQEVVGTVSFDGQPVTNGEIVFEGANGEAPVVGSPIKDGKFELKTTPGKKKVKISATREEGKAPDGLPNYVPYIPKKYNDASTLEQEIKSGKNELKFDLTK
jgi:hypothetical protein